ncbi:acid--CoA ligase [Sphingomonas oleivorans]|uniref:3-methylmercaptopropionyl-CoA ligase n=1 Tax=Sphingomonas oleivorans TaxID=1735121 RepID=A0A2T5FW40_9SPHN|nr:AMP-binding protein [Sphingomonas oleivorans]PTQ09997.1 acid--CoA ligase [Sphingomonas oleivorans]
MTMLPDPLARRAELTPERIAFEMQRDGRETSYGALDRAAGRAAAMLAREGVRAGDRVAMLAHNRIEFFELLFACARLGAIMVPLNWRLATPELAAVIADCEPMLLFHEAGLVQAARAAVPDGVRLRSLDGDYLQGSGEGLGPRLSGADECWYLLYTSGTTGRPKGVIQTYGMAQANHVNVRTAIGLGEDEVTLAILPLFHTAGINLYALPTLFAGGRVILGDFEAGATLRTLAGGRVTSMFGVPTIYQALSDQPGFAAADLSRVRFFGSGGGALPEALQRRWLERGLILCNGMGMTETGPTAFVMDRANAPHRIGSVGKTQLLLQARLVSGGRDVGPGEVGEIWFAGASVTPGYWRQPEATAAAFSPDGWLKSGDLARRDADGFHYVVGRAKEMFVSGGENVYPAEVEAVLLRHPAVVEAAVVGAPDPIWGEVGHAYVVARAPVTVDALARFCRERLAAYKVPRDFGFVARLPRNAAGKVEKRLLVEDAL